MVKIEKQTPGVEMSLEVKIFNIKNIQESLEKMLDVVIDNDELSLYMSQATRALENAFEYEYS